MPTRRLLPAGSLAGRVIALSVSDSEDLAAMGFVPTHMQLALAEIARVVFVGGARLLYGGDLRAGGHTELLLHELSSYARAKGSLTLCLAWSVHRRTALASLEKTDQRLGIRGEIRALDATGQPLADWRANRPAQAMADMPEADKQAALTAMREDMCAMEQARITFGGRRRSGDILPGVLQETGMSLARQHPVFLVGGFGGITLDMAAAIDPRCLALRPASASGPGPAAAAGLADITARAAAGGGWALLHNGLGNNENLRLAATHRPSEIAALVATGLGRLASP